MSKYEVVIGLETHVELATKTKMFCSCKNEFGSAPNTNCCEVCTAMPGALPVPNKQAIEYTIKAGLATNCKISNEFYFDRKGYFYPDSPKAYQISQFYVPICTKGYVEVLDNAGKPKKIRIHQIHLEEDAGKLVHSDFGESMVDLNRCGVPLIECVTEPDFRSVEEVMQYLEILKSSFKFIGISECKMERGQLRCDVNISLMPVGSTEFGTRTEMKNVNSFKAIERAIKYEIARQEKILDAGKAVIQDTLRWDDVAGTNYPMRSKEDAHDYRYFPEPDILNFKVTDSEIKLIKDSMPLLPREKQKQLIDKFGFSEYDAQQLTKDKAITDFFDAVVECGANAKSASNWIQGEISKIINEQMMTDIEIGISSKNFVELLEIYEKGEVSQASARTILREMWKKDESPKLLSERLGLKAVSDTGAIEKIVKDIIEKNPNAVVDYKGGNQKALAFFVGQTMKATQGKANAGVVNEIIRKLLG